MNYQALTIKAAALAESGQYAELEVICQKILNKKPKHFDALQLLGLAQSHTGQLDDAIRNLMRARKLNPQHDSVLINLANACLDKAQVEDSIKFSREAIKLDASKFAAHLILGNALQTDHQYAQAEQSYGLALQLNSASAEVQDGLGECYKKQGKLSEAIARFIEANELNPTLSTVYIHLLQTLLLMHITDDALQAADVGLSQATLTASEVYELWIGKAKIAWLTGKLDDAQEALEQSAKITSLDKSQGNIGNLQAYANCLNILFEERKKHPQLYQGEPERAIFFVAESHALAPSEVVVNYQGIAHRLLSTLITGCKAWHLANKTDNEYKASLTCFFSALPLQSIIVLGFGEIDCRLSEGILRASQEKNIDYHQSVDSLIDDYLAFALTLATQYQHQIIIYGVPAPNMNFISPENKAQQNQLCDVIQLFNQKLKVSCEFTKLEYLDIYHLTSDASGISNQQFHIDAHHLHPKIFPLLFDAL